MALVDFAATFRASLLETALRAATDWLADMRAARRQEKVLNDLLFLPEHRLRDLGIEPHQIVAALDERYWSTRK